MNSPSQLSFLPEDYMERKAQRRLNAMCTGLFLLVVAGIGSAAAIRERTMREIERQHTEVEREYTEAAKRIEQVRQMQDKQRTMAHQAELTASLLEKVPRSNILAEITKSLPGGVSLLEFSLDAKKKTVAAPVPQTMYEQKKAELAAKQAAAQAAKEPTQPQVFDVTMKVVGMADNDVQVSQFISKLGQSKLFSDVNLVISQPFTKADVRLRKFEIEVVLNAKAEVDPLPNGQKTAAVELGKQ